jgi:hypothetical protein
MALCVIVDLDTGEDIYQTDQTAFASILFGIRLDVGDRKLAWL